MAHTFRPLSRRTTRSIALTFVLCLAVLLVIHGRAQTANDFTYVYDELGRLVAIVDPAGDTVRYNYDAVGNLLSISRQSSSILSVINFNPTNGPVGTSVTIHGTSFSTTPGQNTVTFNGTAATVVSSTATQIVTTVPANATSGVIAVTTSAGTATSATSFTVTAGTAPTITSFTPAVGDPGTTVTITGTNFETIPTNNEVAFNEVLAPVTASSATSITAEAPSQRGMGHISVTTPFGTAVSTDEFFIPPPAYLAADIESTNWLEFEQSETATVSTAGKVAVLFFHGTADQRVSIKLTGVTDPTVVTVFTPDGNELTYGYTESAVGIVEPVNLPATGSYAVIVAPRDSSSQPATGSVTLTLYEVPADVSGTITAGGSAVTVSTTVPGQNGLLTFTGTAGQKVGLNFSNITIPSTNISILDPDSSYLAMSLLSTTATCMEVTLPVAGTYQIGVDPEIAHTGNITLTLYSVTFVTTSISIGGSPVTVSTTATGQNPRLTFSGTAQDTISLKASSVTMPGTSTMSINGPDGNTVAWDYVDAIGGFINIEDLPVTGNYTIVVHPHCTNTGSITLTLDDEIPSGSGVPTITGVTPTIGVATTSVTISGTNFSTTAANNRVSFNGTLAVVNTATSTSITTSVPAGATSGRISVTTAGGKAVSDDFFVPPTPFVVADVESTERISFGGTSIVTLSEADNAALLVFDGTQGQRVSLKVTDASLYASVQILSPDGTTLNYGFSVIGQDTLGEVAALPATGTYTILVFPSFGTGDLTLTLYNVPADVIGTISANATPVTITTTVPGQDAKLTFSGTTGQRVSLKTTNGSMNGNKDVAIISPDGTYLTSTTVPASEQGFIDTQILPLTGTYTIAIDPRETVPGTFTLTLYNVPADATDVLVLDGSPVTMTTTVPGQNAILTFTGSADQNVKLSVTNNTTGGSVYILVTRPDASYLDSITTDTDYDLINQPLPATGTYTIVMEPYALVGSVTFKLETLPP